MSFPHITYKFNNHEEAKLLTQVVEAKFSALGKFTKSTAAGVCEVEFEKISQQQHGKIFRVEVTLSLDGQIYRVEATEDTFEQAIDETRDELDKELRRAKKKDITLGKRAGQAFKKLLMRD